jgi:TP901 family phage tail tape measure protein
MAKSNDLKLVVTVDVAKVKTGFEEVKRVARATAKELADEFRKAFADGKLTIPTPTIKPPKAAPGGGGGSAPSTPAPSGDPAPGPDGRAALAARIKAQEDEFEQIRAKYRGKTKAEEKQLTDQLIGELKRLQDEKRILINAGVGLTDAAAKKELASQKSALDQQMGLLRRAAMEKEGVLTKGAGASAGILGIGREVLNPSALLGPLAAGIGPAIGALGLGAAFKEIVGIGSEFEAGVAELQAITGVAGAALDNMAGKARSLAMEFGGTASGNITAFKGILSKLGPDIASSPAALEQMTRAVNTLSAATGDTAEASMDALTTGLLQFQVPLDDANAAAAEMTKQMNVMAAGAQFGAAEVPQVADAIKVAGVAASGAKVSFEETNAAIQALAAGGKVGAEAGTALRNVLGKLGEGRFLPKEVQKEFAAAGVDVNKLGDTTVSLTTRLRELQKIQGDAALMSKFFGTENAAAGAILLRSADDIDELTTKISGTNTATEQAAIRQATFSAQWDRFVATIQDGAISAFEAIGPLMSGALGGMTSAITFVMGGFTALFGLIGDNQGLFIGLAAAVAAYTVVANAATIGTTIMSGVKLVSAGATKIVTAAQWLWNAAMMANPIGLLIAGVVALVAVLATLGETQNEQLQSQKDANEAELEIIETKKKANQAEQDRQKSIQSMAAEYEKLAKNTNRTAAEQKRFQEVSVKLNEQFPGLVSGSRDVAENIAAVQKAAAGAADKVNQLGKEMAALNERARKVQLSNAVIDVNMAKNTLQEAFAEIDEVDISDAMTTRLNGLLAEAARAVNDSNDSRFAAATLAVDEFMASLRGQAVAAGEDKDEIDALRSSTLDYLAAMEKLRALRKPPPVDTAPGDPPPGDSGGGGGGGGGGSEEPPKPKEALDFAEKAVANEDKIAQLLGEAQVRNAADERARIKLLADNKRAEIERNRKRDVDAAEREAKKAADEGRQIENLKRYLDSINEAARLATEAENAKQVDALRDLTAKMIEQERQAASELANQRKDQAQAELDALIATQEATYDQTAKGLEARLELQRRVWAQERILLLAQLVSTDQTFKTAFADAQTKFDAGGFGDGAAGEQAFREAIARARTEAEGRLANDPRLKAFDTAKTTEGAKTERDIRIQYKREEIALISDLQLQSKEMELLEIEAKLSEDLLMAGANEARKTELVREAALKRHEIETKYAEQTSLVQRTYLAVTAALREAFSKKIDDKERAALEDQKKKLRDEEASLTDSLKRREISYADYIKKVSDLNQKKADVEKKLGNDQLDFEVLLRNAIKEAGITASKSFAKEEEKRWFDSSRTYVALTAEAQKKRVKGEELTTEELQGLADAQTTMYTNLATGAIAQFAQLAAEGKELGTASLVVLIDTAVRFLDMMIPVWIAGIFGTSVAELGPVGAAVAAASIGALHGLASIAKAGLQLAEGDVAIKGPGGPKADLIPAWLSAGESVLNAAATNAGGSSDDGNAALFRWANKTGRPIRDLFAAPMALPEMAALEVNAMGQLVLAEAAAMVGAVASDVAQLSGAVGQLAGAVAKQGGKERARGGKPTEEPTVTVINRFKGGTINAASRWEQRRNRTRS